MSIGAVLGGLLFLASIGLLFWIEHHSVVTAASLEEGAGKVATVEPGKVDPANEGKLVHVTGEASAGEPPTDPDFGISAKALRLSREVEVFQWKETKSESKKDGKTSVTYTYKREWSKDKPSHSFSDQAGHENPKDKPYADTKLNAGDVRVGAFALPPALVEQLPTDEALPVTDDMLTHLPDDLKGRAKLAKDGALFVGAQPGSNPVEPQVGDALIHFKAAKPETVTVVAKQVGGTFAPYTMSAGADVNLIKPGKHSWQEMFESAQTSNRILNWLLRVVSLVLMALALFLVLRRMVFRASGTSPGDVSANIGVGAFAALAALPVVLVVVGLRWLFYQPVFGGGVLAAGLAGLTGLYWFTRSRAGKPGLFAGLPGGGKKWSKEERDSFRRIALDPENAKLRLEFAGGLEKKGDPMGEFIRLDHELESLPEGDVRREPLDRRWAALLQQHGRAWFLPLTKLRLEPRIAGTFFPSMWMHHGVIDEVTIDLAGVLPEKADRLFAAAPGLRVLAFHNIRTEKGLGGWKDTTYHPNVPAIVRLPQLEQIGALKMSSIGMKLADLEAVASSPHLKNLTELDFSYSKLGREGAVALAKSTTLTRLGVLELRSCDLGPEGAVALAKTPNLSRLVSLNLAGNAIGPSGAAALASSAHLQRLQTLSLDDNAVGPAGARSLASSPHLREVVSLDLGRNGIGPEGALALADSARLTKLTTLKLNDNKLGGAGLRSVATSPLLGSLKILELDFNDIDDEGVKALASNGAIRQLEVLSLANNNVGDAGVRALAEWAGLARLTKVTLSQNKVGAAGVAALAASPYLRGLKELNLSNNPVGLAGARTLAGSSVLTNLQHLWICEADLPCEGEQMLRKRFGDVVHLT
jgi:Leucine-rich repeat (LRR) protein